VASQYAGDPDPDPDDAGPDDPEPELARPHTPEVAAVTALFNRMVAYVDRLSD
jgi:hypothetical protein